MEAFRIWLQEEPALFLGAAAALMLMSGSLYERQREHKTTQTLRLKGGTTLIAALVPGAAGWRPTHPAARLVAAAKKANLTVHEGIIATGDQFIHDGATRARIHHLFNALAVEMEGGAVAHTCLLNGVKCGVLRSISDQADGHSDMDYPTFTALAAAHSQQVVENLLRA